MTTPNPASASPHPAPASQSDLANVKPDRNGSVEATNGITREGSIEEGKQKARAMLAASGVQIGNNAGDSSGRAHANSPSQAQERNAERPLSRKRSRSGSRLPQSIPSGPEPVTDDVPIEQWTIREQLHTDAFLRDRERWGDLVVAKDQQIQEEQAHHKARLEATQRNPTKIMLPFHRKRPRNRLGKDLKIPRSQAQLQADSSEELVPIRLDIEFDKLRLRDTFTWNLHDRTVPERLFAETLVEDFQAPPEARVDMCKQIIQSLHEQLEDYHPHPFSEEEALDPHLPYFTYKDDELRILIKLNITIGNHTLVDQFDWDVNNPENSPEDFAKQLSNDMALSGEFMTAIAHSIREQTQLFTKTLYLLGYPFDGRPVEDSDVRENALPSPLPSVFRPFIGAKEYMPYFYELNEQDLERTELVFSREQRQQKRSVNRRGGPSLPDLGLANRSKTWRTQVISSVIPGAAESGEAGSVLKPSKSTGRKSRRNWKGEGEGDSDMSDDDESDTDSPARLPLQGTARTRGMRGAASAAQAAMRANLTRSATPEVSLIHEPRAPVKKFGVYEAREEFDGETVRYTVKLKLHRERFRQWWRDYKARRAALQQQQQQHQQQQQQQMHMNAAAAMTPMQPPAAAPTSVPRTPGGPVTPGMGTPLQRPPAMGDLSQQQRAPPTSAPTSTPGGPPGPQ